MTSDHINNPIETDLENNNIASPRVFPELFTREECNQIIRMNENLPFKEGSLNSRDDESQGRFDLYMRSSKVAWMLPDKETAWVIERINDAAAYVNQYYNFEMGNCKKVQVAQYQVGGHYNWHNDIGVGRTSRRKLSLSVQLSDPATYEGGNLEFSSGGLGDTGKHLQQGSAILFPSYLTHRVSIVTRGMRWSLVGWFLGPPFR